MSFTQNVGRPDQLIRIAAGIVLAGLVIFGAISDGWGIVAGIIGLALLVTGLFGFCPLYALVGVRTCPEPRVEKS